MSQIEKGDTVKLKSGGPLMTIDSVEDGEANCVWFLNDKLEYGTFDVELLMQSSPS